MKIFSMLWNNLKTTGMIYFLTVSKISPAKSLGLALELQEWRGSRGGENVVVLVLY